MDRDAVAASFLPQFVLDHLAAIDHVEPAELKVDDAHVLIADISGFTAMGEQLARQGRAGAEELARRLDAWFDTLVATVLEHGGDIFGFAGDALLASWPVSASGSVAAGLAIQDRVGRLDIASEQLTVRIGVGRGSLRRLVVGGGDNRWHTATTGGALTDAATASDLAAPGDVVVTAHAMEGAGDYRGVTLSQGAVRVEEWLGSFDVPAPPSPVTGIDPALLRSFIPSPVLARLEVGRDDWLGELRTVTVVFASLPNMGADTPLSVVQQIVTAAQHEVSHIDASLNKISVDDKGIAVLAGLGMPPRAHEDDPTRGVQLALALADAAREADLRCYVGVATGRIYCGVVGDHRRREYTLIGATANRAARLMMHAMSVDPAHAVLADESTMSVLDRQVESRPLPTVQLKGLLEPTAPSHVTGILGDSNGPRSHALPSDVLVGRDDQVASVQEVLRDLAADPSPLVVIEGEPGIGKSRLASVAVDAARSAGFRVVTTGGNEIERISPYRALRPLASQLLDLPEGDAATGRAIIEQRLGPGLASQAALLGDVLPLAFEPTSATMKLPADSGPAIVHQLVTGALQTLTADRPTLLCVEDAHWVDAMSLEVIVEIARAPRVGLVLTTRSGDQRPAEVELLTKEPGALHLELGPLDRGAVADLVAATLRASGAVDEVIDAIQRRGSGHPLFTQELARAMAEQDLLDVDNDGNVVPRARVNLAETTFPDSLEGMIGHRIDQLDPGVQVTLKVASVIGISFDLVSLATIHPDHLTSEALEDHLDLLVEHGHAVASAGHYDFIHALTRDVSYERLLYAQRAVLHAELAEWYSAEADDESVVGRLAHHWERCWLAATQVERPPVDLAQVQANAADALEQAMNTALAAGLLHESIELGLRSTRVLGVPVPTEPAAVVLGISAEMQRMGELAGANEPEQLLELPALTNPDIDRAIAIMLRLQPSAAMAQDRPLFTLLALRSYNLVLEHGIGIGAPGAIAVYASLEHLVNGESDRAHHRTSIALDIARQHGNMMVPYTAFVLQWLVNHWSQPIHEILDIGREAVDTGFQFGDVVFGSFNAAAHVVAAATSGMPLDEVVALAEEMHDKIDGRVHSAAFHCCHERQLALALAGRTEHPRSLTDTRFDEQDDIASIMQTPSLNQIGNYLASKTRLDFLYRDYASALVHAEQTTQLLEAMAGQLYEAEFSFFYCLALQQRRVEVDLEQSAALRDRAATEMARLERWATGCAHNFEHKLQIVHGVEAWLDGDVERGVALLDAAASSAADAGFVQHEALAHELAAQARRDLGDTEAVRRSATAAIGSYERWGAGAKVADVRSHFADVLG
jgi:predicted ATPase/class 3 adenylate cyclase